MISPTGTEADASEKAGCDRSGEPAPAGQDAAGGAPGSSLARRCRDPGHLALVVGVFVASRAVFIAGGLRFRANPPGQIHLLDLHELRADPFLAFTSLHIQPPLFNFFVGSVLRWSPFPAGISFQVLYLVAGLATVLCVWSLLGNLGAKPWVATTATILVTLDPLLIRDESALTYETLVALLLALTVWSADRYFRRPDLGRLVALLTVLVVGVLTRTTLNPIWLVGALVVVVVVRPPRVRRRAAVAAFVVALACVAAPLVHNKTRFDTLGFSSFAGMNLERITVLQLPQHRLDELIREKKVSPAAAVLPYEPYADYAEFYPPCDPATGEAVLDEFTKASNGRANLNNICYLPAYRQSLRDAAAVIRNDPGVYAQAVGVSTQLYLSWGTHFVDPDSQLWHDWEAIYRPLMLPVPVHHAFGHGDAQPYTAVIGGMTQVLRLSLTVALAWLLVVAQGIRATVALLRRRDDDSSRTRVFTGFLVLAVSLASVTVDTFENARFREPLDPLLLGLLAMWVLERVDRVVTHSRPQRADDAAAPEPGAEPGTLGSSLRR
jgi:hypothetical protein